MKAREPARYPIHWSFIPVGVPDIPSTKENVHPVLWLHAVLQMTVPLTSYWDWSVVVARGSSSVNRPWVWRPPSETITPNAPSSHRSDFRHEE
jgi:hypothetical protein